MVEWDTPEGSDRTTWWVLSALAVIIPSVGIVLSLVA